MKKKDLFRKVNAFAHTNPHYVVRGTYEDLEDLLLENLLNTCPIQPNWAPRYKFTVMVPLPRPELFAGKEVATVSGNIKSFEDGGMYLYQMLIRKQHLVNGDKVVIHVEELTHTKRTFVFLMAPITGELSTKQLEKLGQQVIKFE